MEDRDSRIHQQLNLQGFCFVETVDITEDGLTHCFIKQKNDIRIHFYYFWDNDGGPEYMVGRISVGQGIDPDCYYRSPIADFSIYDIMERDIKKIAWFENVLEYAIKEWRRQCEIEIKNEKISHKV